MPQTWVARSAGVLQHVGRDPCTMGVVVLSGTQLSGYMRCFCQTTIKLFVCYDDPIAWDRAKNRPLLPQEESEGWIAAGRSCLPFWGHVWVKKQKKVEKGLKTMNFMFS